MTVATGAAGEECDAFFRGRVRTVIAQQLEPSVRPPHGRNGWRGDHGAWQPDRRGRTRLAWWWRRWSAQDQDLEGGRAARACIGLARRPRRRSGQGRHLASSGDAGRAGTAGRPSQCRGVAARDAGGSSHFHRGSDTLWPSDVGGAVERRREGLLPRRQRPGIILCASTVQNGRSVARFRRRSALRGRVARLARRRCPAMRDREAVLGLLRGVEAIIACASAGRRASHAHVVVVSYSDPWTRGSAIWRGRGGGRWRYTTYLQYRCH